MATPIGNSVPLTGDPLKDPLIQGGIWTFAGPHVLSYSFNLNFDLQGNGQIVQGPGGAWTTGFINAFTHALDAWSAVANLSFVHLTSEDGKYFFQSGADIAAALTGDDLQALGAVALGFFPDPAYANTVLQSAGYDRTQYPNPEGDVLLDNFSAGYANLNDGSFGLWTIIHELGHAIGLKHPFDDGGNGRPAYAGEGVPQYNNERYTVMSYSGTGNTGSTGHAATPMPLDILAIQQLYGANMSYHTGTDTYQVQVNHAMRTLWDAGGTDTLDAQSLAGDVALDLRPGALMQLSADTVLGIAYNVTIENAVGGAGNDTLTGNAADNTLTGGAGTNTYYGGAGNDTYYVSSPTDDIRESFAEGTDQVYASVSFSISGSDSIEYLTLTGNANIDGTAGMGTVLMTGNAGNNRLDSGWTGAPEIRGGAGDDTYVVHNPNTTITENSGEGTDTVSLVSVVDYTLPANVENFVLDSAFPSASTLVFTGNALANTIIGGASSNCIDGAAGADTLIGGGGADTYVVDDAGDTVIENQDTAIDTVVSAVTWTLGQNLENLVLAGGAAIDGTGNALANVISGNAANNALDGAAGNDTLDGGAGIDTAVYSGNRSDYVIVRDVAAGGFTESALSGNDGTDLVKNVEVLKFADSMTVLASASSNAGIVDHFSALRYIASYADLITTLGANAEAGITHYLQTGFGEGRSASFDALRYLASYPALIASVGTNVESVARHFIQSGHALGQIPSFDGLAYIASYADLGAAFGTNAAAGIAHFVGSGYTEGRVSSFAPYQYIASYADLTNAFHADAVAGAAHFILAGRAEGRSISFDGIRYIASYADLITAFGANPEAAAQHYLLAGKAEGRSVDFDGLRYVASNPELIASIHADVHAAALDYVQSGFAQGKLVNFDGLQYIASYADLIAAFGTNAAAGIAHFVANGYTEGRMASFNAQQYLANYADLAAAFGSNLQAAEAHFIAAGFHEQRTDLQLVFTGTPGDDALSGNAADNTIIGGLGNDSLAGGAGNDLFVFNTPLNPSPNVDTITDFSPGTDKLLLDHTVFAQLVAGSFAAGNLAFVSNALPDAIDTNDFILYNTDTGRLSYDPDGSGPSGPISLAVLATHPTLTAADFSIT